RLQKLPRSASGRLRGGRCDTRLSHTFSDSWTSSAGTSRRRRCPSRSREASTRCGC
ncbi:unnamed protein product, partial [Ectocarpus sp. 4 AP-2014]